MIPGEFKERIIQDGILFISSITEAYGPEIGIKLWEQIASVLDPSVKGEIFFAMISGHYQGRIRLHIEDLTYDIPLSKIEIIKTIRSYTGLGLKEAKDIIDNLLMGKSQDIVLLQEKDRYTAIRDFKKLGVL
jgi:hypothetical protein